MSDAIKIPKFEGPSPMDHYADFMKHYGVVIENRRAELRRKIAEHLDDEPSAEMRDAYAEFDSIRNFEPELHRLIHAFTAEAVKPLQEVLTSIAMRTLPAPMCGRCGDFLVPGAMHICSNVNLAFPEESCKPL